MTRRDKIHHIRQLDVQLQRERTRLATSVAGLSRALSEVHPAIVFAGGVSAGFVTGTLLRAVRRGPARRAWRVVMLARAWAVRLSLSRLFSGASASGANTHPGID